MFDLVRWIGPGNYSLGSASCWTPTPGSVPCWNESPSAPHQTSQDREQRRQLILEASAAKPRPLWIDSPMTWSICPMTRSSARCRYPPRHQPRVHLLATHQAGIDASKKGTSAPPTFAPSASRNARFIGYRLQVLVDDHGGSHRPTRSLLLQKLASNGHFPFDQANALPGDHLSSGLRPLVCLAGTLTSS